MLEKIKHITECNPKLIVSVVEWDKAVLLSNGDGTVEPVYFNENDFEIVIDIIKEEIKTRPNAKDRIEDWECISVDGCFSLKMQEYLLDERRHIETRTEKVIDKRKLKELCDHYNVPDYMGPLFLSEIKLGTNKGMKDNARNLGLL